MTRALCGPTGGIGEAHAGLRAFWEEVGPSADDEELDAWLSGDIACVALLGPVATRRQRVARWALAKRERGAAEVVFVPVSALYGTATLRDVLTLSFGLLASSETAAFSTPRGARELRAAWELALSGVDWVSSLPNEDDPVLVWVLEGVDALADGDVMDLFDADALGGGARVVFAMDDDASTGVAQLDDVTVIRMASAEPATSSSPNAARDLLATVLAPLSAADFASFEVAVPTGDAVLVETGGRWRFAHEALRSEYACDRVALEQRIVGRGLALADPSPYLVAYLGAHMARQDVGLAEWMQLVTPAWMELWRSQAGWLVGFITDVERARSAAVRALLDGDMLAMVPIVRCVLVETSLYAKEGSRSRQRDRSEPYRLPDVDLATPTGADRERAIALATLIEATSDAAIRDALQRVFTDFVRGPSLGDVAPAEVPSIVIKPADDTDTARLRAASPNELGVLLSAFDGPSLAGLTRDEIVACAERTAHVYRVTAFAQAAAYAPQADRAALVQRALAAYAEFGDTDTQRAVLALAPWMDQEQAASLFCDLVAGNWGTTLPHRLTGWAGVTDLIPLLRRLGGDGALQGVAEAIVDVGHWLP